MGPYLLFAVVGLADPFAIAATFSGESNCTIWPVSSVKCPPNAAITELRKLNPSPPMLGVIPQPQKLFAGSEIASAASRRSLKVLRLAGSIPASLSLSPRM